MSHLTLAENVAHLLRHAIQSGEYMSGERLVELTLAHELNVSQNTVRDALRLLEQEGWLVKHARQGVFVRTFSRTEADEIYALRVVLEDLALGWVLSDLQEEAKDALREQLEQAEQHLELSNWKGAQAALFGFHSALVQAAHKPQTAEVLDRLHNAARILDNLRELRFPRGISGWHEQITAYRGLMTRIERGEVDAARAALRGLLSEQATDARASMK